MQAVIFSLALNFWSPDGVQLTAKLIDASVTQSAAQCTNEVVGMCSTWYFIAKENEGLQNSSRTEVSSSLLHMLSKNLST
jgi:hypothetical protein